VAWQRRPPPGLLSRGDPRTTGTARSATTTAPHQPAAGASDRRCVGLALLQAAAIRSCTVMERGSWAPTLELSWPECSDKAAVSTAAKYSNDNAVRCVGGLSTTVGLSVKDDPEASMLPLCKQGVGVTNWVTTRPALPRPAWTAVDALRTSSRT
jgi:hypothetical protein